MKIVVIAYLYPSKKNPIRGIFIKEQVEMMIDHYDSITVFDCTPYNYKEWFSKDCSKISFKNESGYNIFSFHPRALMSERFPRVSQFFFNRHVKKVLVKYINMFGQPDLIVSHFSFMAGFAASKIHQLYGTPFVVVEHGSLFLKPKLSSFFTKCLNNEVKNAKHIVCVSQHLKKSIDKFTLNKFNNKITVINNPLVPIFTFNQNNTVKHDFVFLSAGNLFINKNFDLLINSFCLAFTENENVRLRIAGSGKEHDALQRIISSKERKHQIVLVGQLDRTDMLVEYQNCDSFVLFSQYETFGIAYREAMAVGRPVVSSLNGGIEENWEDNFGILVKTFDVNDCATALRQMVSNYQEFDQKYISERTISLYSRNTAIKKMKNIILGKQE